MHVRGFVMDCADVATPDPVDLLRDEAKSGAPGLSTLTLQIEGFESRHGASHYCLAALAGGRRVGFSLELRCPDAEPLALADHDMKLPRCELRIHSTGEESDHFVSALAAVYDLELAHGHMPEQLEFHALCLAGDPTQPRAGVLQLMLLYSGTTPQRRSDVMKGDFEWFLRIDHDASEVGFIDRVADHHASIVAALSGGLPRCH